MTLPSKKIAPTLIASLIAVGGVIMATMYNPKTTTPAAATTPLSLTAISPVSPDLENEIVSTTSPIQTPSAVASALKNGSGTTSLSNTQKFAQDLFAQYMEEKQGSNQPLSDDDQSQIIQNTMLTDTPNLQPTTYTQTDIKISSNDGPQAIKAYGNAVATIMSSDGLSASTPNELEILDEAVNNKDQNSLGQLDTIISAYQGVIAKLLALSVPQSAATIHLELINTFSAEVSADQELNQTFSDPIVSLYGVQNYEQTAPALGQALVDFGTFLKNSGADFTPADPGSKIIALSQ